MPKLTQSADNRISLDKNNGAVRSFFGTDLVQQDAPSPLAAIAAPGDSKEIASAFLSENEDRFKFQNVKLGEEKTRTGSKTESVVYKQLINDVPVYGVEVVVGIEKANAAVASAVNHVDYSAVDGLPTTEAKITGTKAVSKIKSSLKNKFEKIECLKPRLFVYRHDGTDDENDIEDHDADTPIENPIEKRIRILKGLRQNCVGDEDKVYLAWVTIMKTQGPFGKWEVFVDATDGEILWINDKLRYVNPKGLVFYPDPVTSSQNSTLRKGSAKSKLTAQLKEVELERLNTPVGGRYQLNGKWVTTKDLEPPKFAPPVSTSDFKFEYGDRRLLSVMAYYWTDQAIEFVRSFQLHTLNQRIDQFKIKVDGQGVDSDDNSWFTTDDDNNPYLAFGEGGVSDASDAHVIVHEFGHAIHWYLETDQNKKGNEEGFGDFFAGAWLDQFNTGEFQRNSVFPWDNVNSLYSTDRFFNTSRKFTDPNFKTLPIHVKGSVLAATLWEIYLTAGGNSKTLAERRTASNAVIHIYLEMLTNVPSNAAVKVIGEGLITADQALFNGKHKNIIASAFNKRGITIGVAVPA